MHGYYPPMGREPVAMAQVYPPARSYSLAKLNLHQGPPQRDFSHQYEKVRVEKTNHKNSGDRRPHRLFEGLRRQQSYDGDVGHVRHHHHQQQMRRQDGFNSLQLLGAQDDGRYLDRFMETHRGRAMARDHADPSKGKDKNKKDKNSMNSLSSKLNNNKENKLSLPANGEILALIGSLTGAASVDSIYESVEQIHYRKTVENLDREEKVRSIQKTGHPLFDRLREERALAGGNDTETYATLNSTHKRTAPRTVLPNRKTSATSSPTYSSTSSGDEQDVCVQRSRRVSAPVIRHHKQQQQQQQPPQQQQQQQPRHRNQQNPSSSPIRWGGRPASAGSESDEDWIIPRPKFYNRRREVE
ncbi:hypothetical protein FHG87_018611 [Trinorchestia longiramus]|nr:hypothetical protein FHG87_018611 [Trinorchestia longiramus]